MGFGIVLGHRYTSTFSPNGCMSHACSFNKSSLPGQSELSDMEETTQPDYDLLRKQTISRIVEIQQEQTRRDNRRYLKRLPIYLILLPFLFLIGIMTITLSGDIFRRQRSLWFWSDYALLKTRGNNIWWIILDSISYLLFYGLVFFIPYCILYVIREIAKSSSRVVGTDKLIIWSFWIGVTFFAFHREIFLVSFERSGDNIFSLLKWGCYLVLTVFSC
jgi:hypothetical protein